MGEQGIHQGAVVVAGRRVNNQSCRLVEDDQVRVFKEDRKMNRLGHRRRIDRRGQVEDIGGPRANRFRRLGHRSGFSAQPPLIDQRFDPGPGQRSDRIGQESVYPLPGVRYRGSDLEAAGRCGFAVGWHMSVE